VPCAFVCDSWLLRAYRWQHRDTLGCEVATLAFSKRSQSTAVATGIHLSVEEGAELAKKAWGITADGRIPESEEERIDAAPAAQATVRRPPRRLTSGSLAGALAHMPVLQGSTKRVRGAGDEYDEEEGEDEYGEDEPGANTTNVAYATVTRRGYAVVQAALASSSAAGTLPGGSLPSDWAQADDDSGLPQEEGAEYEFAFLVRDMRQPLRDKPVAGCLPVTASELTWTIGNTGCLQVPGYGIEDDDEDDLADRAELAEIRASKRTKPATTAS
jgi:hypothetical protein